MRRDRRDRRSSLLSSIEPEMPSNENARQEPVDDDKQNCAKEGC